MKHKTILYILVCFFLSISQYVMAQEPYKVTTQKLNVRSIPYATGQLLGTLAKGQTIEVLSIENGWAQVNYKNKKGYVSASYIEKVNAKQDETVVAESQSSSSDETDYSNYSTTGTQNVDVFSDVAVEEKDYADITGGFIVAKYDYITPEDADWKFNGISIGYLFNPLDRNNKKSSWTMQIGAFVDYYWHNEEEGGAELSMHYLGLTVPLHLLGWQFSDGKGTGFSIHGGFEFTFRVSGDATTKINGTEIGSVDLFDKDKMGNSRLKHFGCGFAGAADFVSKNFYASVGYKLMTPLVHEKNSYGPFFVVGFSF